MGQYEPFGERGNGELFQKINIYVCIILSYFFSENILLEQQIRIAMIVILDYLYLENLIQSCL